MKQNGSETTQHTSQLAERLFERNEPVELVFQYLADGNLLKVFSLVAKILSRMDKIFFLESLITILRELLHNAQKANAKRLFFRQQDLVLTSENDYEKGMDLFREYLKEKVDVLRQAMEGSDFYVKVGFRKTAQGVVITISNNSSLRDDEKEKIRFRMGVARSLTNFMDVYNSIYDTAEGAGLGIILAIMLMRHSGIGEDCLTIHTEPGLTSVSLLIPVDFRAPDVTTEVKKKIMQVVECLPSFPQSINELLAMCGDPSVEIDAITEKLLHDPSLAADVLKLANSAGFVTGRRIETIHDALMIIGIDNLESVLIVAGARRILSQRYRKFEDIWEHCNKTAFYAGVLAQRLHLGDFSEKMILAGLLHDLGKIVLLSVDMNLVGQIAELTANRKIRTTTIIEEASIGLSHASLGGMIAMKWNFPEYLVEAIALHHAPLCAMDEYRDMIYAVYLANLILGVEEGRSDYCFAETQVLERFKLNGGGKLKELHDKVMEAYSLYSVL